MPIELCPRCEDFRSKMTFDYSDAERFKQLHDILVHSVREGRFVVEEGDLTWSDRIECVVHCTSCGRRFRLVCETLHGQGGSWTPEDDGGS